MTANDNIRHYIGDLETTENIDIVFKHIYDLMLANGGEGSGLNADMLDGYHASDFAPIALKDDIDNCIHSITFQGEKYTGKDVILKDVLARMVSVYRAQSAENINVEEFLQELDDRVITAEQSLDILNDMFEFFETEDGLEALQHIITHNINQYNDNGIVEYYLDSDSVNGLSFRLITQQNYDLLPNDIKEDPHNIFIINNEINDEEYTPPSLLRAGMNLEFRIHNMNIEFSIDNGTTWNIALPLVGEGAVDKEKGVLYPAWFSAIKDVIEDEELDNQEYYPFLLNTDDNLDKLNADNVTSIKFGQNNNVTPDSNGVADIETTLTRFLNNWLESQYSNIAANIQIPDISGLEEKQNKATLIAAGGNDTAYPTTKAVADYISSELNLIQNAIDLKESVDNLTWKPVPNFSYTLNVRKNSSDKTLPKSYDSNSKVYAYYNKFFIVIVLNCNVNTSEMNTTSTFYSMATCTGLNSLVPGDLRGFTIYSDTEVALKNNESNSSKKDIRVRNQKGTKSTSAPIKGYMLFPRISVNGLYI